MKKTNIGPAPGHKRETCPGLPGDFELKDYINTPMTNWFSPGVLLAAGIRDLLSRVFAAYADQRATIAALSAAESFDKLKDRDQVWVDYVADVGDGWHSTYSVAWCLAQLKHAVKIDGTTRDLPRGNVLVMGGDQVYPYASAESYNRRLVRPYQAALPCAPEDDHPLLFAIPGNHDWTDSLRGFQRRFCQGHWLGGWKTKQTRPYWSIQLPHGWWLWGVDSQMDDYIDQAQVAFFRKTAEQVQPGDRIILCVAAPSWIFAASGDSELHRNLAFIENDIICGRKAHLVVTLSGDLHHFAHYRASDDEIERHKITCGGGGAFTHGTHHLPDPINLVERGKPRNYRLEHEQLPDCRSSKQLLWKNLFFPFRHLMFAGILGGFYLAYALVLANAGLPQQLAAVPLDAGNILQVGWLYTRTTFAHVWPLLFFGLLLGSGYLFAQPDWHSNPQIKPTRKFFGGLVHALMHLAVLVPFLWGLSRCNEITLPPFAPDWVSAMKFSIAVSVTGTMVGGVVFGIYLSLSNLLAGFHRTEAFSAARDSGHKSFLRMQIHKQGLTIYPLGLNRPERNWEINSDTGENKSWINPAGETTLMPELIGEPIEIKI